MILSNFFVVVRIDKHLRILQLPEMSSRFLGSVNVLQMKVLPCDLFGQVILRPRWRYIYSTLTYIYTHRPRKHAYILRETTHVQKVHVEATGYVFP